MDLLKQHIEALIFCSEESISLNEIYASLKLSYGWEPEEELLLGAIDSLKEKYASEDFSFELCEIADGYLFLTKKDYHATVTALIQHKAKKRLSTAQMETLAIIAYRQPVTKTEVEHIRGVNCDYAVQKLLEKELIEIHGKSDSPGKPIIYATSPSFMDYFGIKSVKDLPQLKDIHPEQNEIGEPADYFQDATAIIAVESESEVEPIAVEADDTPVVALDADVVIVAEVDETILLENVDDNYELPDRKTIFMEHGEEPAADETETTGDSDDYNLQRD